MNNFNAVLDFLNSVLYRRGPSSVPYQENVKSTVLEHLSNLYQIFPTLTIGLSDFHSNDGRLLQNLLKAEGTIPIVFNNIKYNIPIAIWLLDLYPYQAPLVFVVPAANMVIKSPHPFVDRSGQACTPMVQRWQFPSSNLVDLTVEMAQLFGSDPPLYSQPSGSRPPMQRMPSNQAASVVQSTTADQLGETTPYGNAFTSYNNPITRPSTSGSAAIPSVTPLNTYPAPSSNPLWGPAYVANMGAQPNIYPPQVLPSAAYGIPPPIMQPEPPAVRPTFSRPPGPKKEDLESSFRDLAVEALCRRLAADLSMASEKCQDEMGSLLEEQHTLEARKAQLEFMRSAIDQERNGVEGCVRQLGVEASGLRSWLERNEQKVGAAAVAGGTEAAEMVIPVDALTKQVLASQAEDLGVEDTVLALDKALQAGTINVDAYVKQVRAICRKQFFSRALSLKMSAARTPAPPPPMPAVMTGPTPLRPYPTFPSTNGWARPSQPPQSPGVALQTAPPVQHVMLTNPLSSRS